MACVKILTNHSISSDEWTVGISKVFLRPKEIDFLEIQRDIIMKGKQREKQRSTKRRVEKERRGRERERERGRERGKRRER